MQTKERNERGGNGDAPVTSSGLGKEGSNFWWARKRKRLLAVYCLFNSLETVTPPSILLERRVEKTDPRSANYPLTPAPRTTLRTTPTDYPKKSTKFLLRSTKIQKAYLLFLHDHNCTKNSRHFLFLHFSTQSFSFCPILHRPATCQNAVSTMDDR